MTLKLATFSAVAIGLVMLSGPVFAHHGFSAYDATKTVTVMGIVTDFEFVNPHVQLYFDVKDDNGDVQHWGGELATPNVMVRKGGWNSKTLKTGDEVTITGNPAKQGSYIIHPLKIVSNGRELNMKDPGD